MRMMVKNGELLFYPDGGRRGHGGYVVDPEGAFEEHALKGQLSKLVPCPDYCSTDPVDLNRLQLPSVEAVLPPPKKGKKTKAKKAAKKKKKT